MNKNQKNQFVKVGCDKICKQLTNANLLVIIKKCDNGRMCLNV